MKKAKHCTTAFFLFAIIQMSLSSCCNYYKAIVVRSNSDNEKAEKIDSLHLANRDLILRNGPDAFLINQPVVNLDKKTLSCTLDQVPMYNRLHLADGKNGKMRYKKHDPADLSVLNEAHIYMIQDTAVALGKYEIDLSRVNKIEVLERDKRRSTNSYVLGGLGITLGIAAIFIVIAAASLSSMSFGFGG